MQRPQYLQSEAVSPVVTFIAEVSNIRREGTWIPWKSQSGAIGFALNFLWLLSLFQDKESKEKCSIIILWNEKKFLLSFYFLLLAQKKVTKKSAPPMIPIAIGTAIGGRLD